MALARLAKQGDVEISNFPISLHDGLDIDVSFVCEFKGSSRAPGGWNNGVRHTNDVLQARANVKNYSERDETNRRVGKSWIQINNVGSITSTAADQQYHEN